MLYSLVTWGGMALFGREKWLEQGEVFHVAFGLYSRFAPVFVGGGCIGLRVPAEGLLDETPVAASLAAFALLLLCSVTFDGFRRRRLVRDRGSCGREGSGHPADTVMATVGPPVLPRVFAGASLAVAAVMAWTAGGDSTSVVVRRFVLTLVPIAIGSDPFDLGWNLFATRLHAVKIGVIEVYPAEPHFRDAWRAIRSQWSMWTYCAATRRRACGSSRSRITEAG